jgi:hypothetical protein
MAIDFILEDGTGKSTATSYVSVAEYKAYWTNRGIAIADSDDNIKIYLNLATEYVDSFANYKGQIYSDTQALLVPRDNWYDVKEKDISNSVPVQLKNAVCEFAYIRKADNLTETKNTGIASESYGPVSISYSGDSGSARITYPNAMRWLKQITIGNSGMRAIPT